MDLSSMFGCYIGDYNAPPSVSAPSSEFDAFDLVAAPVSSGPSL